MVLIKSPTENPNAGVAILNAVLGLPRSVEMAISFVRTGDRSRSYYAWGSRMIY